MPSSISPERALASSRRRIRRCTARAISLGAAAGLCAAMLSVGTAFAQQGPPPGQPPPPPPAASPGAPPTAPPPPPGSTTAAQPSPPPQGQQGYYPPPPGQQGYYPPPPQGGYPPPSGQQGQPGSYPPGYGPYPYPYGPPPYYYPPGYYSTEPAPAPPPPTKRANGTMMAIGITMTAAGAVAILSGLAALATANNRIDVYCDGGSICASRDDEGLQLAGGIIAIGGVVVGAAGIPLWVIGGRRVPLKPGEEQEQKSPAPGADKAPRASSLPPATLRLGLGSASINVAF